MDNSGYIVLSRQMGLFRQMDVVANNVANANTHGYKANDMLFNEILLGQMRDEKLSFTQDIATARDLTQGELESTGRPLDAAINGKGYFVVSTPLGERYTRVGSFQLDATGTLVTSQGYPVLDENRAPLILSEEDRDIVIREDGNITVTNNDGIQEERGRIVTVKFENERQLTPLANGLYSSTAEPQDALPRTDYQLAQGMMERSNVNSVLELTQMIEVSRATSSTSKYLNDLHELQRRAFSTITKQ